MSSIAKSIKDQINKDLVIQNKRMKAYISAQISKDYTTSKFSPEESVKMCLDCLFSGEIDHLIGYKS